MMGALEQARIQQKAPWPNATPEEDAAYDQQVHMGDMEFEQGVASHMGPYGREALDVERAEMIRTKKNWNVLGFQTPEMNESERASLSKTYRKIFEGTDQKVESDMVYAVGPAAATNAIWSHEFLHRYRGMNDLVSFLGEEMTVVLHDGFRANSTDDWERAVKSWTGMMLARRRRKNSKDPISLQIASDNLKEMLRTWEGRLIKSEVDAAKRQNIPAKKRGFTPIRGKNVIHFSFDSLKKDQMEALERRKKHWHFKSEKQEK